MLCGGIALGSGGEGQVPAPAIRERLHVGERGAMVCTRARASSGVCVSSWRCVPPIGRFSRTLSVTGDELMPHDAEPMARAAVPLSSGENRPTRGTHFVQDARVVEGLRYISDHRKDPSLCLREVSQHVNLSEWHFSRLLKDRTGCGFTDHVRSVRTTDAAHLLSTTFLSVKEISARVGYQGASHFGRDFRREHNVSPSKWRTGVRGAD
jgi:AraC-like DNA-binding protein